jgi:ectoine hydroxylase-related dioxygenase (phytanoyl-CoA dioxygenase family)
MNEYPFSDSRLRENAPWDPLVRSLLGEDAQLKYCGLIISFPGSTDQPWHGDGPHLFGARQLPPHGINVFIPLHDITKEHGPTEFLPGSHRVSHALGTNEAIMARSNIESVGPLLEVGSSLLYDYRVLHRGTHNCTNVSRLMFYMLYTKPWFNETINFGEVSIFSDQARSQRCLQIENPDCAAFYGVESLC